MNKLKITLGALALAMVVATFFACSKEKESNVVQQATVIEEVARKPIATYDIDNRIMHDHFDLDFANSAINENNLSKETGSRYVIESARVIDSVPLDINSEIIRKIVILDTEEELSITCWCIGAFVDKIPHPGQQGDCFTIKTGNKILGRILKILFDK